MALPFLLMWDILFIFFFCFKLVAAVLDSNAILLTVLAVIRNLSFEVWCEYIIAVFPLLAKIIIYVCLGH